MQKDIVSMPSLASDLLRQRKLPASLVTANAFEFVRQRPNVLSAAKGFSLQVTGTRWTTSVNLSDDIVPGPNRRFDGALATPARCILSEDS